MDVNETRGFLVADLHGRPVGRVEHEMFGTQPEVPDALAVRSGHVFHRHFVVPTAAIDEIDPRSRVIALRLQRSELTRFL